MNAWFETEWAGMAQVFRLRRYVKEGDQERVEIVYGVTNLPEMRKPTPYVYWLCNELIGASKIGCIIVAMSP